MQLVNLGEPGVQTWGPGQNEPTPTPYQAPSNLSTLPSWLQNWFKWLQTQ